MDQQPDARDTSSLDRAQHEEQLPTTLAVHFERCRLDSRIAVDQRMVGAKRKPEEVSRALGQRSIKAFFGPAPPLPRPQQPASCSTEQAEEVPKCCAEDRSRRAAEAAADGQAATAAAGKQGLRAAVACTSSPSRLTSDVDDSAEVRQEGESCLGAAAAAGDQREQHLPPSAGGGHSQQQVCEAINPTGQIRSALPIKKQAEDTSMGTDQQQRQQPGQQEQELRQQSTSPAAGSAAAAALPVGSPASSPRGMGAGCRPLPNGRVGAAGVQGGGAGALTALELQRLQRIRRNQEMMVSMGLAAPGIEKKPAAAGAAAGRRRPPRKQAAAEGDGGGGRVAQLVRRSARKRGTAAEAGVEAVAASTPEAAAAGRVPEAPPELHYDDSSVRRYVCELATAGGSAAGGLLGSSGAVSDSARISGFRQLPGCLSDPALARAYSIDWRPGLVVAGGKDGVVCVFGSRQLEAGQLPADASLLPLLSGKLHKGWVAEVQLLSGAAVAGADSPGKAAAGLRLLTAGNDGALCLWDLSRAAEAGGRRGLVPQCLARATGLHQGGIFSLHERGGRILTASKDGTVAISALSDAGSSPSSAASGAAGITIVQRCDELHEGVVKCARWREAGGGEPLVFASCGNDRQLCVVDARQSPSAGASLAIPGAHSTATNCLRWHPASEHLLLSASHDPAILLHDLRSPGQPLHRLLGHAPGARIGQIYQPCFVAGGDAMATGCERSQLLSLYCTRTGAAISRGDAGLTPGATFCRGGGAGDRGDPLVLSAGRAVYLFAPSWAEQVA